VDGVVLIKSTNPTGYMGVFLNHSLGFQAKLGREYLGTFKTAKEAAVTYAKAKAKADEAAAKVKAEAKAKAEALAKADEGKAEAVKLKALRKLQRAKDKVTDLHTQLLKARGVLITCQADTLKYLTPAEFPQASAELKQDTDELNLDLETMRLFQEMEAHEGEGEGEVEADIPDLIDFTTP